MLDVLALEIGKQLLARGHESQVEAEHPGERILPSTSKLFPWSGPLTAGSRKRAAVSLGRARCSSPRVASVPCEPTGQSLPLSSSGSLIRGRSLRSDRTPALAPTQGRAYACARRRV